MHFTAVQLMLGLLSAMHITSSRIVAGAAASALVAIALGAAASLSQTSDDDVRAAESRLFTERVERYVWLRAKLEEPLPSFDLRRDPWSLFLTRRYLAAAIRTARAHARGGDIFAPPVEAHFRDVIEKAVYELDIEGLVADHETVVDLIVNEPVPVWALRPVPPKLLERLPPLPDAIEYRIVSGALILWDVHAEILIDGLPYAFIVE